MSGAIASGTLGRGPVGSRRRSASAIAVAISAISLAVIPAATARSAKERRAAAAQPAPPLTATAPASGSRTGEAAPPPAPPVARKAERRPHKTVVTDPSPAAEKPAAPAAKDPGRAKEEAARRKAEHELHHREVEQQRVLEGRQRTEAIKQHVQEARQAAQARQQTHETTRKLQLIAHQLQVKAQRQAAKAAGGAKGSAGSGHLPSSSHQAPSTGALAAQVASLRVPAPAVAAPAPTAATSTVLAGNTRQAAVGGPPRARARAHLRARPARSAASVVRAPLLAAVPVASAPRTVAAVHRAKAVTRPTARPSAIVTTITRIVGVVPTLVWALVAVLAALALALAARTRLSGRRARRLEKQRGELLDDVGLLQTALLPIPPDRLGPVGTTAAYRPAAGPAAGGDFYDIFALEDGRLAVIVGDVSGHGRGALPHTALVRFTLRAYLEAGLSPRVAVQTAGAVLDRQLGSSFATVVAATYDPRERVLVYSCAGHPPPIVTGTETIAPVTISSAPPVGAGMRTGTRQTVVSIPGAARICFHTDGVTEARVGSHRELYGSERLTAALADLGEEATAAELLDRVTEQTDSRPDDMAACVLRIAGPAAAPAIVSEELELDRDDVNDERIKRFLAAVGIRRGEVDELMIQARGAAQRSGSVVMVMQIGEGSPEVTLRRDNVAYIQPRLAARQADLEVSL
jgi:hypothetical protein